MSEGKKKEPKTIHVDTLIIKANEVVYQPEPQNHPVPEYKPVRRDFWGFPIPEIASTDPEDEKPADVKKEDKE
jgi:hypothetical protein